MARRDSGMTNLEKIAAISWAANRADTSYGDFVVKLSDEEKEDIYAAYRRWRRNVNNFKK